MTPSNTPPPAPPQARLMQATLGVATMAICRALIETGVIEQMRDRSRSLDELANACRLHRDVLFRTLRFATASEITTREDDQYTLSDAGRLLLKDVPGSMHMAFLIFGSEPWQRTWSN